MAGNLAATYADLGLQFVGESWYDYDRVEIGWVRTVKSEVRSCCVTARPSMGLLMTITGVLLQSRRGKSISLPFILLDLVHSLEEGESGSRAQRISGGSLF